MYCYTALPLDLHVLGLPLAFILSQDQTLLSKIYLAKPELTPPCHEIDALDSFPCTSFWYLLLYLSSSVLSMISLTLLARQPLGLAAKITV